MGSEFESVDDQHANDEEKEVKDEDEEEDEDEAVEAQIGPPAPASTALKTPTSKPSQAIGTKKALDPRTPKPPAQANTRAPPAPKKTVSAANGTTKKKPHGFTPLLPKHAGSVATAAVKKPAAKNVSKNKRKEESEDSE